MADWFFVFVSIMVEFMKSGPILALCLMTGLVQANERRSSICGPTPHFLNREGFIHSPFYPNPYPPRLDCKWTILPPPFSHLIIIVHDFEIEKDKNCSESSCCTRNYLSLPFNDSHIYANFCGDYAPNRPIHLTTNKEVIIKFRSHSSSKSRGFKLSYVIGRNSCDITDFRCHDGVCWPRGICCDGYPHCVDQTDEMDCPDKPFSGCTELDCDKPCGTKKPCNNAKCLHPMLWCDGNNDCGDNSDEENCIRNSVISATIMGCLFCGLMLVIAVMCALRLYTIKNEAATYRLSLPPHVAARLSMTNSISLPALLDDEFFHREPPPAYSVAVGQSDCGPAGNDVEPNVRVSRSRSHRPLKPLTPPASTDTSNQSSPSRGSITSSSYLSNEDVVNPSA